MPGLLAPHQGVLPLLRVPHITKYSSCGVSPPPSPSYPSTPQLPELAALGPSDLVGPQKHGGGSDQLWLTSELLGTLCGSWCPTGSGSWGVAGVLESMCRVWVPDGCGV